MAYGHVRFSRWDLDATVAALRATVTRAQQRLETAQGADEQAFYSGLLVWLATAIAKFTAAKPGRIAFEEDELQKVRGALFAHPDGVENMARDAYVAALGGTDQAKVFETGTTLRRFNEFNRRMGKPSIADTSQDAEPDDDDDETDD